MAKKKPTEPTLLTVGLGMFLAGLIIGGLFTYQLGKDKGINEVYIGCKDYGEYPFYRATYQCWDKDKEVVK